jgi:glutathione S-transferase
MTLKLVIAKPSPFARKVRVALREKWIDYEEMMDVPWNPDTKAPSLNPLGKIPILICEDGHTVFDSSVIVEYLETLGQDPQLIPSVPSLRVSVRQIEALADGVSDAVVLIVLESKRRADLISQDWLTRQRAKVDAGLKALAGMLKGKTWFVGEHMSVADIAAACTLAYVDTRVPGVAWRTKYPVLAAFSDRMEARPSFAATRPEPQEIVPLN